MMRFFNKTPTTADLDPAYEIPTISLAEKEKVLFDKVVNQHLNEDGCLLNQLFLPVTDPANYQRSHDTADFPVWHGHWIAALAMKLAVEPSVKLEILLYKAVKGLAISFDATGISGLLPRSYLKHDNDEPLSWMELQNKRPTRYWQKGEHGYWFRNGVAKGHYAGAVFGLATIIGLVNKEAIVVNPTTMRLVHQILLKIAHYLIDNDYKIIDITGKVTEFGKLNWWFLNGYNGLQLLAMLRAGKAIRDAKCTKEYDRLVKFGASTAAAITAGLLGRFYYFIGRENAFGQYSDDQYLFTTAFTLYLNSNKKDEEVLKNVKSGLKGMWKFLRYSRKSYISFIYGIMVGILPVHLEQAIETLRLFPDDKRQITNRTLEQTHEVQPICNQKINVHYWKTDYFRKITVHDDVCRTNVQFSAQDYLFVYWLGRYFNIIKD